jgi:transposase
MCSKSGSREPRSIARGYILLLASQGKSDDEIAQTLEVGRATVQRIRKRFCQKGLDHALTELPRPGAKPRLDGKQEAYLVALACSDARSVADQLDHARVREQTGSTERGRGDFR